MVSIMSSSNDLNVISSSLNNISHSFVGSKLVFPYIMSREQKLILHNLLILNSSSAKYFLSSDDKKALNYVLYTQGKATTVSDIPVEFLTVEGNSGLSSSTTFSGEPISSTALSHKAESSNDNMDSTNENESSGTNKCDSEEYILEVTSNSTSDSTSESSKSSCGGSSQDRKDIATDISDVQTEETIEVSATDPQRVLPENENDTQKRTTDSVKPNITIAKATKPLPEFPVSPVPTTSFTKEDVIAKFAKEKELLTDNSDDSLWVMEKLIEICENDVDLCQYIMQDGKTFLKAYQWLFTLAKEKAVGTVVTMTGGYMVDLSREKSISYFIDYFKVDEAAFLEMKKKELEEKKRINDEKMAKAKEDSKKNAGKKSGRKGTRAKKKSDAGCNVEPKNGETDKSNPDHMDLHQAPSSDSGDDIHVPVDEKSVIGVHKPGESDEVSTSSAINEQSALHSDTSSMHSSDPDVIVPLPMEVYSGNSPQMSMYDFLG